MPGLVILALIAAAATLSLSLAIRAHNKVVHGGCSTIIRNVFDNGEPWTTICAVGEGI